MATLKICVQKQRSDGFYPVYIRVTHKREVSYIKTEKVVDPKGVTRTKEIKDPFVIQPLSALIVKYMEILNRIDAQNYSCKEITEYLKKEDEDISFSEYARKHINNMINSGHERNARNYQLAVQSMELYAGTNNIMFSRLTSTFVGGWMKSLETTKRAKEMYPTCVRQVFKSAVLEYNDYDNGIIKIKTNPWGKIKIPTADVPKKLAISPEDCRKFFSAPIPESKFILSNPELGRDVAMMVLCLGGINTVDLYELKKTDYTNGVIHYNRRKTMKFRPDEAYMEMKVPDILLPLLEKYKSEDEYLFNFHSRYKNSDSFGANSNGGIRKICESLGIPKEDDYCVYSFRHTWGTVAQNDCGASLDDVAFGMNHASAHRVTRGYVKIDYSPAWVLNQKVVDFIFFSNESGNKTEDIEANRLRISPKYMVRGTLYFRGTKIHEISNIGYNNKEEVIEELSKFIPDEIPSRSMLQYKIENTDREQVAVYERMKK